LKKRFWNPKNFEWPKPAVSAKTSKPFAENGVFGQFFFASFF